MTEDSPGILGKPVSIKVRVDGSVVAIVKTDRVGRRSTVLPAKVTEVSEGELTVVYELSGKTFEHWLTTRRWKKPG